VYIDAEVLELLQNLGFSIIALLTAIFVALLVSLFVKGYQNGN